MSYRIIRKDQAVQEDVTAIATLLQQFNLENGPEPNYQPLVFTVEDDSGRITGGLFGKIAYRWLHVEYLIVPAGARRKGVGSQLLEQAEQVAREDKCVGVFLDTFSFQALPFYRKRGYTVLGELEQRGDGPQYFLKKRLD